MGDEKLPKDWVKAKSKSHPDKFYYFNRRTKESTWNYEKVFELDKKAGDENKIHGLSNNSKTIKKNIANARMKELQKKLKQEVLEEQIKTHVKPATKIPQRTAIISNEEKTEPITPCKSQTFAQNKISPKKSRIPTIKPEVPKPAAKKPPIKQVEKKSPEKSQSKPIKPDALSKVKQKTQPIKKTVQKSAELIVKSLLEPKKVDSKNFVSKNFKIPKKIKTDDEEKKSEKAEKPLGKIEARKPIKLPENRDATKDNTEIKESREILVKKQEVIQKKPEVLVKKPEVLVKKPEVLVKKPEVLQKRVETTEIPRFLPNLPKSPASFEVFQESGNISRESEEILQESREILTPKSLANDRLQKFREKLTEEAKEEEGKPNISSQISSDEEMEWLMTDDESETTEEPMEWEDIDEQDVIDQVQSIRTFKSDTNANVLDVIGDNTPMSKESQEFLVILDTNILISNLDLVASIKGQYFKDIGKAVIYLPYIVLVELDKLKTSQTNLAKFSRRAINFVNERFREKDPWFRGQSALQDDESLISITSGDDSILNCCLQAGKVTKKLILLSNDVNLRNKALVNNIQTFSSQMFSESKLNENCVVQF